MNSTLRHVFRFVFLTLAQVMVFKRINLGGADFNYVSIIVYPLAIMLLPIQLPTVVVMIFGLAQGMMLDAFYDSPGVHTSACVFIAYMRFFVLGILEPTGGYNAIISPTKRALGFGWFLTYTLVMLFIHLLWYFSVEAFSFVYIKDILLRTASSFVVSVLFVVLYQFIFDPTE